MSAVDRFIAGEDKLSNLLRAIPVFEPPQTMSTWVASVARAVAAERGPAKAAPAAPEPVVAAVAQPVAAEPSVVPEPVSEVSVAPVATTTFEAAPAPAAAVHSAESIAVTPPPPEPAYVQEEEDDAYSVPRPNLWLRPAAICAASFVGALIFGLLVHSGGSSKASPVGSNEEDRTAPVAKVQVAMGEPVPVIIEAPAEPAVQAEAPLPEPVLAEPAPALVPVVAPAASSSATLQDMEARAAEVGIASGRAAPAREAVTLASAAPSESVAAAAAANANRRAKQSLDLSKEHGWPINAQEWNQLATTIASRQSEIAARNGRQSWILLTGSPRRTLEVRDLALRLRDALPREAELKVLYSVPKLGRDYARLIPPQ